MLSRSRTRLALALLAALGAAPSFGADFKRFTFPTVDGVELEGTFYPSATNKKDTVVLLLHDFDPKTGGDSHKDGWDDLAERLQKEGYAVFAFDFRGFGNSKTVKPEVFWSPKQGHNRQFIVGGMASKPPETIDQKKFRAAYYPYLINDIAAAKAFLDRKNDTLEVNTSNFVVIGAGNGATLGALWLWSQCRLQRDRASLVLGVPPALDDPEGRDVAAAVWLSLSDHVPGGRFPVHSAVVEVGRECKVPTAFLFGKREKSAAYCGKLSDAILGLGSKKLDLPFTGKEGFDTNLAGSKLLDKSLPTEEWIVEKYLNPVVDKRGSRERRRREIDRYAFYWAKGKPNARIPGILAKHPGEELIRLIPWGLFEGASAP
jgi:pimeloyl-ACP methyl ester carboxylesterase